MPTEARAAQNAEIGPLPVPSISCVSPLTEIAAASLCLASTTEEDWGSSSATAPSARQVEGVAGLHHVGDAALARLAVDPDDGLVGAADVVRVDGQVRQVPLV